MHVEKQELELDMEQQTGSKSGKEYIKDVYCHLAYLTFFFSPETGYSFIVGKCSWHKSEIVTMYNPSIYNSRD